MIPFLKDSVDIVFQLLFQLSFVVYALVDVLEIVDGRYRMLVLLEGDYSRVMFQQTLMHGISTSGVGWFLSVVSLEDDEFLLDQLRISSSVRMVGSYRTLSQRCQFKILFRKIRKYRRCIFY